MFKILLSVFFSSRINQYLNKAKNIESQDFVFSIIYANFKALNNLTNY
jgi:hypothetical protein